MVLVHSMTPLIPSFAAMLTSATNPWVSGEHTSKETDVHELQSRAMKVRQHKQQAAGVLTHVSRGDAA